MNGTTLRVREVLATPEQLVQASARLITTWVGRGESEKAEGEMWPLSAV